jgi:hypothetical protein
MRVSSGPGAAGSRWWYRVAAAEDVPLTDERQEPVHPQAGATCTHGACPGIVDDRGICGQCGAEAPFTAPPRRASRAEGSRPRWTVGKVVGLVVGLAGFAAAGVWLTLQMEAADAAAQARRDRVPPGTIDVGRLARDYRTDEARADATYLGKWHFVRGRIAAVRQEVVGIVVLELQDDAQVGRATAFMQTAAAPRAAGLSRHDEVILRCEGGGLVDGRPALYDCTLR